MSKVHITCFFAVSLLYGLLVISEANLDGLMDTISVQCNKNLYEFVSASMDLELAQVCIENNACFTEEEQIQHFKPERDALMKDFPAECERLGAWNITLSTIMTFVSTMKNKSESLGRLDLNHTKDLNCETNGDNIVSVLDKFLEVARHMICAWQELCFTSDEYKVRLEGAKEKILTEFREKSCSTMTNLATEQERLFMSWLDELSKEGQTLGKAQTREAPGSDDGLVEVSKDMDLDDDDDDYDDDTASESDPKSPNITDPVNVDDEPLEVLLTSKDKMQQLEDMLHSDDYVDVETDEQEEDDADLDEQQQEFDFDTNARVPEALNSINDLHIEPQSSTYETGNFDQQQGSVFNDPAQKKKEEL